MELRLFGGGKGKYFKKFQNERKSLEKNHKFIEVNPFISQEQLVGEISSSDIFLFASSCENLPITVLEGMISGKPIASSNRGPMPEVLHDGAFFFDPKIKTQFRKRFWRLLKIRIYPTGKLNFLLIDLENIIGINHRLIHLNFLKMFLKIILIKFSNTVCELIKFVNGEVQR